jgi:ABC-type branched-subunit amino acid transport system permease subunit
VNRLKLLAFAFGGAVAGFTGTVFAAVQIGVFPQNFDLTLLVMIYAGVILGGMGSLPGVLIGAGIVAVLPEVLRTPDHARLVFYGVLLLGMMVALRPWRRLATILGGAVAFGLVVRWGATALWPDAVASGGEGIVARVVDAWVLPVEQATLIGNVAFVALIVAVVALTRIRGGLLDAALVPVIYLAAFVWENRLVAEASVTRQLILGALLVVMMIARPHGLLGTPRVETL